MARRSDPKREPRAEAGRWLPVVIESPTFSQKWSQYRLTEVDRTTLLEAILSDPEAWPVQRGTAGARKARFASHELDAGTSGGYRVFYAVFRKYEKLVLVTLFPENVQANLSQAGRNMVAKLLVEIEKELEAIERDEKAGIKRRRR